MVTGQGGVTPDSLSSDLTVEFQWLVASVALDRHDGALGGTCSCFPYTLKK
jgi:hypothetical protein